MRRFTSSSLRLLRASTFALSILGSAVLQTPFASEAFAGDLPTTAHPFAYALLVGSPNGGEGQEPLRYAESDAKSVGSVLRDLGRFGQPDLRTLVQPSPKEVLDAIEAIGERLRAHKEKGEEAIFIFYYSGHAKAQALNLGKGELPIATLREKLAALPSTLSLVLLDACQSGAFARAKGATGAADFSYNSVAHLTQKGLAVMASSSSAELSQESEELKSSFFTHHLLTALRGAGDQDHDGRVSLDEAYRYAYRRTLESTSKTQIGGQHVTFETNLAGIGELPITYPTEARAKLALPETLTGRVLVTHKASGSVMAEVFKAKGEPVRLALVAGSYSVLVQEPKRRVLCEATLVDGGTAALDVATCQEVEAPKVHAKGEEAEENPMVNRFALETSLGLSWAVESDYTKRLREFSYQATNTDSPAFRVQVAGVYELTRQFALVADFHRMTSSTFSRDARYGSDDTAYSGWALGGALRGSLPVYVHDEKVRFSPYLQLGIGVGAVKRTIDAKSSHESDTQVSYGPVLGASLGFSMLFYDLGGAFLQANYEYAPVGENLLGDKLNAGGMSVVVGTTIHFGGK